MLTLAINTSSTLESVALISDGKVLDEINWKGERDESEKLLPYIAQILKRNKSNFGDIKRIIVISGPGPFSALRIGVTVANTLAFILGVELFSLDTPTFWEMRIDANKKSDEQQNILLLHAGGDFVQVSVNGAKQSLKKIDVALKSLATRYAKKTLVFFGDITENETQGFDSIKGKNWKFASATDLPSFGETIAKCKGLKKEKVVSPKYFKPPNISKPKKT